MNLHPQSIFTELSLLKYELDKDLEDLPRACKVIADLMPKVLSVCLALPVNWHRTRTGYAPEAVKKCIGRVQRLRRRFTSGNYCEFMRASWGQVPVEKLMREILEDLLEALQEGEETKLLESWLKILSEVEPSMPDENTLSEWRAWITKSFGSHPDTEHQQKTRRQELRAIYKPGTGGRLLKSEKFEKWKNKPEQTLYCPGLPGSGKTVMTSLVAANLQQKPVPLKNQGVAVFYCGRDKPTSTTILACLANQLLSPLITMVLRKNLKQPEESAGQPTWDEMKANFERISREYGRVFVLIDGLDRCGQTVQHNLLSFFSVFKGNLLLTSRILPGPIDRFSKHRRVATFRIAADDSDIAKHAEAHVGLSKAAFPMSKNNIDSIIRQSKGMFLYVTTVLKYLESQHKPAEVLESILNGTDKAHFKAIFQDELQSSTMSEIAKLLIGWAAHSAEPLTPTQLCIVLATDIKRGVDDVDERNAQKIESIVASCDGWVIVDEPSIGKGVHFSHPFARSHFQKKTLQWIPDIKDILAKACIAYLSLDAFKNGPCSTDVAYAERLANYPFYEYASKHWMTHVSEAPDVNFEYVIEFLRHGSLVSSALQRGPMPATTEPHEVERTASELHMAAQLGLVRVARAILKSYAGLATQKDAKGRTPLWVAIEYEHLDVAKLLLNHNHETTTAVTLVQQGNMTKLLQLLSAGYEVNTRGSLDRTLLHHAVIHGRLDAVRELVQRGADVTCEDRDGSTPLSFAIQKNGKDIFSHLLESSASANGIKASNLFVLFDEPETKVMMLEQDQSHKEFLSFISTDQLEVQIPDALRKEGTKRLLCFSKQLAAMEMIQHEWIELRTNAHGLAFSAPRNTASDDGTSTYSATLSFPSVAEAEYPALFPWLAEFSRDLIERPVGFTWRILSTQDTMHVSQPQAMHIFTNMPGFTIAEHQLTYVVQLIACLMDRWLQVCEQGQVKLRVLRKRVLDNSGENKGLLGDLLLDAQKWTELQQLLQHHYNEAMLFSEKYALDHNEASALEDVKRALIGLKETVNDRLDKLEKASERLIEIEFNLVSIKEAREGVTMSRSMKRLSWITFIFLPATFSASLFGMNINLLKDNPHWGWYLLVGGACLSLTFTVFLVFKFTSLEDTLDNGAKEIEQRVKGMGRSGKQRIKESQQSKV